ncbi:hypothetical protein GLAREA_01809 [Glarea lozoyensis ATCC 20868]|uniref:Uncharacterized protein n=1 Tax=Glarea lozoyensis (strain ATCC 20868 / MF5171) TaxID=1116229 RepID=S3CHF5_GLAL2|nr:uncharacterized protein GLAREA_01809 [Glarea lozoyensis ATCC 20868]EPE25897.1 hypothetical protein GLAREA_01809 [Glarea lozoyensis ATCC 20868]
MQFTTIIATSILAVMATAAPVAVPAVEARAQQLIDLWQDSGFLGLKFTGSSDVGKCVNLPSNFNDRVSSGKAKPGFRCTTWVDANCVGTGFSFNASPGASSFPSWINDKSSSWKCVAA